MTLLDDHRRTDWTPRMHRRHEIVTTGGLAGALTVGHVLRSCGYQVRDFSVDVREGVPYSSVTCTVSLSAEETETFAERLRAVPEVVAVDPF
ncbi:MAG TPA: hypothetical protein VM367_16975 [Pseudonocardia sp.]|nr:hypothetical protein [Pseudonocardia sp.]